MGTTNAPTPSAAPTRSPTLQCSNVQAKVFLYGGGANTTCFQNNLKAALQSAPPYQNHAVSRDSIVIGDTGSPLFTASPTPSPAGAKKKKSNTTLVVVIVVIVVVVVVVIAAVAVYKMRAGHKEATHSDRGIGIDL